MTLTAPLSDRVAWITGGAAGIGAATVNRLRDLGATVAVLDLSGPADGTTWVRCDLADPQAIEVAVGELADTTGLPDIVVANAGIPSQGRLIPELPREHWQRTLDVNLTSVFDLLQRTLPTMQQRGWGRIVTVASGTAVRVYPGAAEYAASKAALIALTKVTAMEGAPFGVTANVVAPGLTDTALGRGDGRSSEDLVEIVSNSAIANPMKALLQPDDPATAIAWFCHPDAGRITGQTLHVNAGSYMP